MKEWETSVKYIEDIHDRRKQRGVKFVDEIFKAVDSSVSWSVENQEMAFPNYKGWLRLGDIFPK